MAAEEEDRGSGQLPVQVTVPLGLPARQPTGPAEVEVVDLLALVAGDGLGLGVLA